MNPRVAVCLLVSKILVADGVMTENEREFLRAAMRRLGLTDAEQRGVIDLEGWDAAEAVARELPAGERIEIVSTLLDAASVDGRLSPLEMQEVKRIAGALGVG